MVRQREYLLGQFLCAAGRHSLSKRETKTLIREPGYFLVPFAPTLRNIGQIRLGSLGGRQSNYATKRRSTSAAGCYRHGDVEMAEVAYPTLPVGLANLQLAK